MSTITKEDFISCVLKGKRSSWDKIIKAYCQEFDKKEENIDKLLSVLALTPVLMYECYNIALDYFFIKFEVSILKDKNGIIKAIY